MRYFSYLVVLFALFLNCASWTEMDATQGSRYIITEDEIKESSAETAYDAIQKLRPGLLDRDQRRAVDLYTVTEVVVYLNGLRYGNKESLKTINALEIAEIKYLSASEATIKFGSDHSGGAFLIKLK